MRGIGIIGAAVAIGGAVASALKFQSYTAPTLEDIVDRDVPRFRYRSQAQATRVRYHGQPTQFSPVGNRRPRRRERGRYWGEA
jgi:hypothetical protein